MRYHIAVSVFIDIFYAVRTEKVSFAVVQKGKRVFGIDNLGDWHCHPFGKPNGGRWYIMKLCQIFAYNFSDLGAVGRRALQDFFLAIAQGWYFHIGSGHYQRSLG